MVLGQRRGPAIAMNADEMDSFLAWLRITPLKIISWDFRKLADPETR
jgi:hypothetical protein